MKLVENDFRVKEINAKERATFQNDGNYHSVYKERKLVEMRQQEQWNGNFVRGTFLNMRR